MEVTDHDTPRHQTRDDHRRINARTVACLVGIVVVMIAWWSSYRNVTKLFIPVTSKRSIEFHQVYGRITLSFERYGGRPIFAPTGYRPARPSFFQQRPLAPDAERPSSPWFEYQTVGYAILGGRSGKPSLPGYFWTFPHALLVLLLAISPLMEVGQTLLKLRRTITPDAPALHTSSG